jgi:hypothetical protein
MAEGKKKIAEERERGKKFSACPKASMFASVCTPPYRIPNG